MRTARRIGIGVLIVVAAIAAWRLMPRQPPSTPPEDDGPAWFEDVTDKVGLNFVHDCGPTGQYQMPQVVGSGCALIDLDGDGRLSLYLMHNVAPGSASTNKLYRNRPDGTFEDVSAGSGLDFAGPCMGAAVGDVNNDGKPDLLVTMAGGVKLFLNLGGGKFADVTEESGLKDPHWATSATFLDYDRDGRLDLFVCNYLDYNASWPCFGGGGGRDFCSPGVFAGTVSRLFHNRGSKPGARVWFEDVSVASGIGTRPGPALGVVAADFTGDGWPDLFVANDGKPNHLWVNKQNGTFTEEAVSRGVAYTFMGQAYAGMGIAVGDADNDGMLDIYVSHLTTETNTLWLQGPRGLFRDRTVEAGLATTRWRGTGFGTVMVDFNHDGWLDIAVVNGGVAKFERPMDGADRLGFWAPYAQRNQLFANVGNGKFKDVSMANGPLCGYPNVGRGLAVGDLDGDGAIDLVVTAIGERTRIFRNVAPNRGHWLQVRAFDPALKRDAYGAEVTVTAGGNHYLRLVNPGDNFLCSNSPVAHFGFGSASQVEAIEVHWPDGVRERFPGGPADRSITISKGAGEVVK